MNYLSEDQSKELTTFLLETAKEMKAEAPFVFEEIVTYGMISYGIELAIAVVGLGLSIFFASVFYKWWNKQERESTSDSEDGVGIACGFFGMAGGVVSTIALIESIFGLCKVTLAPRVYVLEFLAG